MASSSAIKVMVNGMPGPMALETARVCVNRGYELVATGFTGPKGAGYIDVVVSISLIAAGMPSPL